MSAIQVLDNWIYLLNDSYRYQVDLENCMYTSGRGTWRTVLTCVRVFIISVYAHMSQSKVFAVDARYLWRRRKGHECTYSYRSQVTYIFLFYHFYFPTHLNVYAVSQNFMFIWSFYFSTTHSGIIRPHSIHFYVSNYFLPLLLDRIENKILRYIRMHILSYFVIFSLSIEYHVFRLDLESKFMLYVFQKKILSHKQHALITYK